MAQPGAATARSSEDWLASASVRTAGERRRWSLPWTGGHARTDGSQEDLGDGDLQALVLDQTARHGNRIYLGAGRSGWAVAGYQSGVLVLGPPRSGKTTAIVIPAILAANGAVVSTSTKPDVLAATVGPRRRLGTCWLFDPSGQQAVPPELTPLRWSPVAGSSRWEGALVMAHAMLWASRPATGMLDASHWAERAEALVAPLLHAAALDRQGMDFVFRAVHRDEVRGAASILESNRAEVALDVLERVVRTDERERSSIFSTAAGALKAYQFPSALSQAGSANFDPGLFPTSVDTVYVCAPARLQDLLAPIVVGLIEEIRAATYAQGGGLLTGGQIDPPVFLALDEVANMAPLPELGKIVSEGGSQGLLTLACLQDLSQARVRWGPAAEGFMSLFGTKVVLPGIADLRTLEVVSALAGEVDAPVRSVSRSPWRPRWRGPRYSVTTSTRRQRRLPVDSVAHGRKGHALLIDGPAPPAWMRLTPWYSGPPFSQIASIRP